MARKRKILPELTNIEISGVAAEGKSIAKVSLSSDNNDRIVVFIPYGAPGDIVNLKLDKKKKSWAEGHITSFVQKSDNRVEPRCKHFMTCGGCKWQHLPYSYQIKCKQQQVEDALQRIAKVELPLISPILGSSDIWYYRNKMEYTFSNKKWRTWEEVKSGDAFTDSSNALGFHISGAFDKVLHINNCYLQNELGDKIRNWLYDYAETNDLSFYDLKAQSGFLRTVMIRIASTGEVMICVVFGENNQKAIDLVMTKLSENFPEITSLLYVVNLKVNDTIGDQTIITFKGRDYINEEMEGLQFRVNAKSFYQTNSHQAYELYKVAREFAGLKEELAPENKPLLYDLYTGTGTIANFVAKNCKKVIGIEYVPEAIEDAKLNSKVNCIDNTLFYAGDMKDILTDKFIAEHGHPDIMIIDPPRAGMHEDVVKVIMNAEPKLLVYVSCNPATQARDIALLDEKYRVTAVQPVDMFPHTHHVENVVKLERRF